MRIIPDSVRANIGDSVAFTVRAFTSGGQTLPIVPFSLYTPEFLAIDEEIAKGAEPKPGQPLVDKWSHQQITTSGVFRAERAGVTSITGSIGDQRVKATLVIGDDSAEVGAKRK